MAFMQFFPTDARIAGAVPGIAIVGRLSVCLSICLVKDTASTITKILLLGTGLTWSNIIQSNFKK